MPPASFCGGLRNDELALSVLPIDLEWAGKAQRDLCHPCEVLDVPAGHVRVERVAGDVLQLGWAEAFHKTLALVDDQLTIVVVLAA